MSGPQLSGKPFDISKQEVWRAYQKVKANKGAPGVDDCSVEAFEKDLKNNLYKIWNRMSSGSYFPPPVRAVEIPKPSGGVNCSSTQSHKTSSTAVFFFSSTAFKIKSKSSKLSSLFSITFPIISPTFVLQILSKVLNI